MHFWIVKINYFFKFLPIYEHFQIWFLNEFFVTFDQKRLIFCQNRHFLRLIIGFFWLQILEKGSYGLPNIIFEKSIFCYENLILNAKNEKHYFCFISSFYNRWFRLKHKHCLNFILVTKNGLLKNDVWNSKEPFFKNLEPKNDYQS